jgi:hypothetical protein
VQDNLTCVRRGYHDMQEVPAAVIHRDAVAAGS